MNVVGVNTEEAKQYVKSKLLNQWVILDGDLDTIERLENSIYTPGTPKNREFEIALLSPFQRIFLAKKNAALKKLFHDPPDFSGIIVITFTGGSAENQSGARMAVKPEENFAEVVDELVEDLFSDVSGTYCKSEGVAVGK